MLKTNKTQSRGIYAMHVARLQGHIICRQHLASEQVQDQELQEQVYHLHRLLELHEAQFPRRPGERCVRGMP